MRQQLVKALRPLDAVSVENGVGPGIPDINYAEGWIECKWLRNWPKRPDTIVRLSHPLMPNQKAWIARRVAHGGAVWVMLQCRREWLLFKGPVAIMSLGHFSHRDLCSMAYHYWPNGLNVDELISTLKE